MFVLLHILSLLLLARFSASADEPFQCKDLEEHDATTKGEISSPFYKSGKYPDMLWCEYKITAPAGYRIKLTFKDVDIDPTGGCSGDKLIVFGKDKGSVLAIICGRDNPRPIISNEGESEIRLLFQSDYMVGGKGFLLEYEAGPNLALCGKDEGVCRNRNCYDLSKACDGEDHCLDGTDEENCDNVVAYPNNDCGEPPITPRTIYDPYPDRMYGGEEVIPHSWPWQVSIQRSYVEPNGHFCGGSLVSGEWVLTAAHCFKDNPSPQSVRIVFGAHNKYNKTKYQQYRVADKIISYPDLEGEELKKMNMNDDIALIRLNAPIDFSDGVQPVCLPHGGWEAQPGWSCYTTGWGETRGTGFSDVLKQAEQVVQHVDNCTYDVRTQICVDKELNSPCHGDSGGPLVCKLARKWYVLGITSYGTNTNYMSGLCGMPNAKVIFSKVSEKSHWVRNTIEKHS